MLDVKEFFDPATSTLTYVVWHKRTLDAVVIDPVWDYDANDSKVSDVSAQKILKFIREKALRLHWILETHAHADHLSASQILKRVHSHARIGISAGICIVQSAFKDVFGFDDSFKADGSQFDRLFADGEIVKAGELQFKTLGLGGHTPACIGYFFEGAGAQPSLVFVGDAIFMPDQGTGRCDFPGGSAEALFDSIQSQLFQLSDETEVYVGHDYQPGGRELRFKATVSEQKKHNIHVTPKTSKLSFVAMRKERDTTLSAPRLLLPSLQVNIRAGLAPEVDSKGRRFLKIPFLVSLVAFILGAGLVVSSSYQAFAEEIAPTIAGKVHTIFCDNQSVVQTD
jgi:glyoxylase-like metal-dependent hydrolase (beta-lactamase superfamily II)